MGRVAALFAKHFEEAKRWEPEGIIKEFKKSIGNELDLRHEGRNADIFRSNFKGDASIYVPKIYWPYSSRSILVMEIIDGRKLGDFFDPAIPVSVRKQIASNGANAVLKQIFEFGMSFLPISAALQRLENEGLLESRPRVGTRVRTPTPDEVRGRYVVREALEAQSARLCCERATFQERIELRRMAAHLDSLYARSVAAELDPTFENAVHQNHMNLHLRIAEYARCPELKETIEKNQVLIYNWFYDVAVERRLLPERFHRDLVDAIGGDDPRAADEAMRLHVRYGLDTTLKAVEQHSATGDAWRLKR
jgi:DNA-binding GntR family transcriptional regulator